MIPLYKPYMPENLLPGLKEILYSGKLSFGNYGKEFEYKLSNYIGSKYLLSISSYNTAMLVLLSTLDLKYGDEIIASPVSCLASNQPFVVKGLKIVWADINPETGTLCSKDVESKVTKNTKAIFHNHFCGYIGDIENINAIGKKYGIYVIDDAIEAFGATYKGNRIGNVGTDVTIFSFQSVRMLNTIDGGALIFKDKSMQEKALLIRDFGIDRSKFRTQDGEINVQCDIKLEGYSGLMSEVNSFIGLKQLDRIDDLLIVQSQNAKKWENELLNIQGVKPLILNDYSKPNYWVFGIICDNKQETIKYFRQNGFFASGVHINNNIYSVFKSKNSLKGVDEFMKKFVAIPCGWWLKK